MKQISSSQTPVLKFSKGVSSQKFRTPTNRIGWLHSISDQPGAKFDLELRDALGRVKLKKTNCGNDTEKFGELVNLEVRVGEDLEVVVNNVRGANEVNLFLN